MSIGNPLLKELKTHIIECRESRGLEVSKDKKRVAQATQQNEPVVEVILQDTILFPEGGGQPSDIGFMEFTSTNVWHVLEVKRHGHHAVHYVKGGKILPPGSIVKVYLGEEGFRRRYDHVCQLERVHRVC